MPNFERLLALGTSDLPECQCGAAMDVICVQPGSFSDTAIKVFRCPNCGHELRLTVWADGLTGQGPVSGC